MALQSEPQLTQSASTVQSKCPLPTGEAKELYRAELTFAGHFLAACHLAASVPVVGDPTVPLGVLIAASSRSSIVRKTRRT